MAYCIERLLVWVLGLLVLQHWNGARWMLVKCEVTTTAAIGLFCSLVCSGLRLTVGDSISRHDPKFVAPLMPYFWSQVNSVHPRFARGLLALQSLGHHIWTDVWTCILPLIVFLGAGCRLDLHKIDSWYCPTELACMISYDDMVWSDKI